MVLYNKQEVGARLRKKRKSMGITAAAMARRINMSGGYYRGIENGQYGTSLKTLILLAQAMDMSLDYLIYGIGQGEGSIDQEEVLKLMARWDEAAKKGAVNLLKAYVKALAAKE